MNLFRLTLSLPETRICINFSTVYNDMLDIACNERVESQTSIVSQDSTG